MIEVILARHGETRWNVEEVFRGRKDIELNDTGFKQAGLLGEHLKDVEIQAVLSSPLQRALKTAEAIASHHSLEMQVEAGLNDLDFGDWQGVPLPEVREKYPDTFREWMENPATVMLPGGESLNDVRERALTVVDRVVTEYEGAVVLVSHRVVNKVLILALLGLDNSRFWNIRQDTCAITTFQFVNGRYVLAAHNDTSYLRPLKTAKLADF